jgi:hypothetical protein
MLLSTLQNQSNTYAVVVNYLNDNNFRFEINENETLISAKFSGENGNWQTYFHINAEREFLQIISLCPLNAKDTKKLCIAELLTRINNNVLFGSFTLHFEDGGICYTTTQLLQQVALNTAMFHTLFQTNVKTLDEYIPAISAVNSGFTVPCLAVQ